MKVRIEKGLLDPSPIYPIIIELSETILELTPSALKIEKPQ